MRYVIDFYGGAPVAAPPAAAAAAAADGSGGGQGQQGQQPQQQSMFIDVRPALDSFGAALDRLRMQWRWAASGRWREP